MRPPDFDFTLVNSFERQIKTLAGQAHDLMELSPAQASVKLTGLVGIVSEWHALIERIVENELAEERHPREDVPTADMSWVK